MGVAIPNKQEKKGKDFGTLNENTREGRQLIAEFNKAVEAKSDELRAVTSSPPQWDSNMQSYAKQLVAQSGRPYQANRRGSGFKGRSPSGQEIYSRSAPEWTNLAPNARKKTMTKFRNVSKNRP